MPLRWTWREQLPALGHPHRMMRPQRTLRQREGATATAHVVDCKFQHRACPSARPRHAAPWVRSVPGTEAFRSTVPLGRLAPQIARKIQYGLYTPLRTLKTASQEDRRDNKVAKLQYFTWVHYQATVLVQVVTLELKPLVVASGHGGTATQATGKRCRRHPWLPATLVCGHRQPPLQVGGRMS